MDRRMHLFESEPQRPDGRAHAFRHDRSAGFLRQNRRAVGQHAIAQLRHGVQHSGDEHVAGNTADDVEMDIRHAIACR
jgi:hypothetical protein